MAEGETGLPESDENVSPKQHHFGRGGLLFIIIAGFFALLVFTTFIGRSYWKNGLKSEIEQTFKEKGLEDISLGDWLRVESPATGSMSIYRAMRPSEDAEMFAAIARVPTLYGAVPAVFLCTGEAVDFVGLVRLSSDTEGRIVSTSGNSLPYWQNKVLSVLRGFDLTERGE